MGRRSWLDQQLANQYFPAIAQLPDTQAGHAAAIELAAQLRQGWYDRGSVKPGEKELSQLAALFDITRSQLKATFGADHFSLQYFGMTTAEYTQLNNQKLQRTADRNEDVKQLENPDAIVAKAVSLVLESSDWFDIAAGLAVLTGRRSSELLATAKFEKASQWSVTFTGALKRGGEQQILSFEIPTLTTADRVIAALAKLRQQLPEAVDLTPEEINRKYGDRLAQACDRHFKGLVPPRGQDNLYTHLFRAVYATIATFWYCPAWVEPTEYRAAIQGHYAILDADDPTLRRSLAASRHYADYEIADAVIAKAGGKRKGIKLGYAGIVPIKIFQRANEAQQPHSSTFHTIEPMPQATPHLGKSKRTPRKSLWINYQDEDLAHQVLSHFGKTDTTEATISAMSNWLRWSIEKLQAQAHSEVDPNQEHQPTTQPVLDAPAADEPSTEVEADSDLDELKSMFTQTLQMFQTFLQTFTPPTVTRTGDNGLTIPATGATANSNRTRPSKTDSLAAASATAALNQRRSTRSKSPETQAETAALTQQILDAIADIQRYNLYIDKTGQPHRLKREITTNFLKALTPNQRLINRILDGQQADLEHHHQQLHIQPGHNSSYREKITLADIQQTLQAGDRSPQN